MATKAEVAMKMGKSAAAKAAAGKVSKNIVQSDGKPGKQFGEKSKTGKQEVLGTLVVPGMVSSGKKLCDCDSKKQKGWNPDGSAGSSDSD
jgi:hypothetical protein